MGRYYFDISDIDGDTRDEIGQDLASTDDVEREVAGILSDVLKDAVVAERRGRVVVSVRDENGSQRFSGTALFSIEQHGQE